MELDYDKIEDVNIENIDYDDSPDFVDAYISSAMYLEDNGSHRPLTEEELDNLNTDWVHEQVTKEIH